MTLLWGARGGGLRSKSAIRAFISRKQLDHLPILAEQRSRTCGTARDGQTIACAPRTSSAARSSAGALDQYCTAGRVVLAHWHRGAPHSGWWWMSRRP